MPETKEAAAATPEPEPPKAERPLSHPLTVGGKPIKPGDIDKEPAAKPTPQKKK